MSQEEDHDTARQEQAGASRQVTVRDPEPSPKVELWARNLHNPSHVTWSDDGRLLVSEHSAGRIVDVTDGGDVTDAEPFVTDLDGPASMTVTSAGRLLVAETWAGRIADVTGGDPETVVDGLEKPHSLVSLGRGDRERVYVTEERDGLQHWITDATVPDDLRAVFDGFPVEIDRPGSTPLSVTERDGEFSRTWEEYAAASAAGCQMAATDLGDRLFVTGGRAGIVLELTGREGRSYAELVADGAVVARGLGPTGALVLNQDDGLLYGALTDDGGVFAVDPDREANYRFRPKLVEGFVEPTSVAFGPDGGGSEMYVCSRSEGVVWKVTNFG